MELKLGKSSLWIGHTLVMTILLQTCQFRPAYSVMLYAIYPTHIAEHRFGHPLGIEEDNGQIAQMGDGGQQQRLQAVQTPPFWYRQSEKPIAKRTAVARLSRFIDAYFAPTLSRRRRRLALNIAAGDGGQLLMERPISRASANNLRRPAFHRTGGTILLGKRIDEAAQAVPAAEAETSSSSQHQHDENNSPLMLLSIVHQPLDGIVVGRRR